MSCIHDTTRLALTRRLSFGIYLLLYPLPWLSNGTTPGAVSAFLAGAVLFLILPFLPGHFALTVGLRAGIYAMIGVALIPFRGYWDVFFISAAATCGAIASPVPRVVTLVAILVPYCFLSWFLGNNALGSLITLVVALGVFATTKLSADLYKQNNALEAAQEEIRTLTLMTERERFARDLHDTLGHSLTLIALKSELALRHLPDNPEKAASELREIGEKSRQALAETRLAVSGIRLTSLRQELADGRLTFETAGIRFRLFGNLTIIPPGSEDVLVMVLREALTNILRHARAELCTIRFSRNAQDQVLIEISDHHVPPENSENPFSFREGNGIKGMRARLAGLDGHLTIERRRDGTTLLITFGNDQ
ncbi:sensor histidine kinase [Asaia prunellae]|uniref:sensor histidine kinase n=1 Tax=Asaia prunellae TaxID=610245 RepID=UPI0004727E86|nr:sensor histidine kinase [Asaia prunellae]